MTPLFRWTLLWIAGSLLMVSAALAMVTGSYDGQEYLPGHTDAFYHARRILDSVFSSQPVIQFDGRIHAPEGSWLTWPWGFDTLLAWVTQAFGPFADRAAANRVLMNIPPAAAPIAVALVVNIARQLRLPMLLAVLFVLGFAALPTVHAQFAVGNVDHHFAELLWVLGTLSAGIWFFAPGPESRSIAPGVMLGCVLSSALTIHNSLFILMVPVSLTLAFAWFRDALPSRPRILGFSVTLLIGTTLVCIPSEPWRGGFFEFYTLSWFHFYLSACVAAFGALLSWLPRNVRNIFLLVGAACLAMIPVLASLGLASDFLSGDLESIRSITEANSPYVMYSMYGEAMSVRLLSGLMWLTGPMVLLNLWWLVRERSSEIQFLCIAGSLGLVLLQLQFRFAVFGEVAMLLTPLLLARFVAERLPQRRLEAMLGAVLLFGLAFYPTLKNWQPRWTLGGDGGYARLRPAFPILRSLCDQQRGVVLADIYAGHWISYHSECSVIGNVFLLTPQHAAKALETNRLLSLDPHSLLTQSTGVRYVLARHSTRLFIGQDGREGPDLDELRNSLPQLRKDLLGPESSLPRQLRKRGEVLTPGGQVYARVFEIVPQS